MNEQNDVGIFAEERKRRIALYVNERGRVTVTELCAEFSVSPATMRNDLQVLHERGMLKRTHGGAMAIMQANFEPNTNEKYTKFISEKKAIAKAALKYIHDGDSIALDAGTTTYELAKLLGQFKELRVVTYDLNIAAYLDANTDVALVVVGGEVRRGHHYMMGVGTLDLAEKLHVDTFFVASNGISMREGITTPQLETAALKTQFMKNARYNVLLADSSKLNSASFVKFADVQTLDAFITDQCAEGEILSELSDAGVDVELAVMEEK